MGVRMRQTQKILIFLLLVFIVTTISSGSVVISPDVLYQGMPVSISYTDLQDGDWVELGFQASYTSTESGFSGVGNAFLFLPFNLSDLYIIPIDGGLIDLPINFFSQNYDFSGMSEGPFFFSLGKNVTGPGEPVIVSHVLAGEKESGPTAEEIVLLAQFFPPRGVLDVFVVENGTLYNKTIPYFQDLFAPQAYAESVTVQRGEKALGNFTLYNLEDGISSCIVNLTLDDPTIGEFDPDGIILADGFQGGYVWYADRVELIVSANPIIPGPIEEIQVATLTYEGLSTGASIINVTDTEVIDADGTPLPYIAEYPGTLTVTPPPPPEVDFTGTPTKGIIPFNVSFQYLPDNTPTSFNWTFGDGSPNATIRNPTHTYLTPGTYDVTLTVTGDDGSVTKQKTGYIEAKQVALWFMGNQTAGPAPLAVEFTGISSAPYSNWQYYFGDGSSGAGPDTTHVYTTPGTYTVKASADISGAKNSAIRYNYIRVT